MSSATGAGGSGTGGFGTGGFGAGGDGGTGGTSPGVVGCERLELHPDPLVIPGAYMGHVLALDDQDLGVLYRASSDVPDKLWDTRSRRLLGPFDAWPPPLTDELIHGSHQLDWADLPHARSDGAFAYLGFEGYAVGSFYDAAVDIRAPEGQGGAYPILEPSPGSGIFWSDEGTLSYYPTLDATEPSMVSTLPTAVSKRAHGVGFDDLQLILQDGNALYVNVGGWAPFATPPDLSNDGQVFPRPGGFYWRAHWSPTLHPYAGATLPPPMSPLDGLTPGPGYQVHAASWRNGAVIAGAGSIESEPGNRLMVAVTDEVNTTSTLHGFDELQICLNGVSVAASPDGDSVYVGYLRCQQNEAVYVIRRFDCVSE